MYLPNRALEGLGVGHRGDRLHVRPRGELQRRPAGQHQSSRRVARKLCQGGGEVAQQRGVQHGDLAVWGIEHQDGEAVPGPLDPYAGPGVGAVVRKGDLAQVDHAAMRSRTTAPPWPPPMQRVASASSESLAESS